MASKPEGAEASSGTQRHSEASVPQPPPAEPPKFRPEPETPDAGWQHAIEQLIRGPDGPAGSGSLVLTTSPGLQVVQDALQRSTVVPECLTARYRIEGPVSIGTLLAAFASDLVALRTGLAASLGDLREKGPRKRQDGWARYVSALGPDTGWLDEAVARPQLSRPEIRELLERFARPLLHESRRLVLLVSTGAVLVSPAEPELVGLGALVPRGLTLVVGADIPALPGGPPLAPLPGRFELMAVSGGVVIDGVPPDEARAGAEPVHDRAADLASDSPGNTDLLGRDHLASTLAGLLTHPDTGALCVGIEAPWGKGKSTFLNLVATSLGAAESDESRAPVVVRFPAWQYDSAEQAWAGLARAVISGMECAAGRWGRVRLRVEHAWARRRRALLLGAGLWLLTLVFAVGLLLFGGRAAVDAASGSVGGFGTVLLLTGSSTAIVTLLAAAALWRLLKPVSDRVADHLARPTYADRLGFQHEVIGDLTLVRDRLARRDTSRFGSPRRVVVMVDDLDRCSDEKTVELLQAIHVALTGSEFYVLLALDGDVVRRAVYRHYARDEAGLPAPFRLPDGFARDYLRKIIQFSIHLPGASTADRLRFLDALLQAPEPGGIREEEGADDHGFVSQVSLARVTSPELRTSTFVRDTAHDAAAIRAYQHALADNPREIKRLINVHRFVKIAARSASEELPPRTQRLLVQLLVVCAVQPDWIEELLSRSDTSADPTADVLRELAEARGRSDWVDDLRSGLPQDVVTPEDLARGSALREAAQLAANVP